MKSIALHTAFAMGAIGLAVSAVGFAADTNHVQRFGRDSVTVWNSGLRLTPAQPLQPGAAVPVAYGRAGGAQPQPPLERHPAAPMQAMQGERYGRA
jgi:hypothetical protein